MLFLFHFLFYYYYYYFVFALSIERTVLTYISLLIIPCMIVYVTNNKEPWTLTNDLNESEYSNNNKLIKVVCKL